MHMAKETHAYGKRDPFIWQKRPIYMAKEIFRELASSDGLSYDRCVSGKRGLFIWQKRPT